MKLARERLSGRSTGLALSAACWALWIALAVILRTRLSPRIGHIGGTNSDEAIVQLMANADGFSGFDLYYWAQERLGAWPFLFARLVRHWSGAGWTCDGLHWLLSAVFFSAVWPLRKLSGKWAAPVAMSLLLALVYDRRGDPWLVAATSLELAPRSWHAEILAIGPPYGWMTAAVVWAWWLLRSAMERLTAVRVAGLVLFSFLAAWESSLAFGFLAAAAALELARIRREGGHLFRPVLVVLAALESAALLVKLINRAYENSAGERQLWFERLPAQLDWGHFVDDFHAAWFSFHYFKAWIAFPVSLALAGVVAWRLIRRRESGESGLSTFALAFPAMAVVNTLAVLCLTWGRIQGHPARYHALTDFFSILGLCCAGLSLLPAAWRAAPFTPQLAALAIGGAAWWLMPVNPASHRIPEMQRVCAELAAAPDGVLFGNYWGTYAFVDGATPHPIVPVIQEMGTNRTEWTVERLRESRTVLVSQTNDLRYGSPDHPVPFIFEHSTLLELVKPRAISAGGPVAFARYSNQTAAAIPLAVHADGPSFSVDFTARDHGTVAIFFGPPNAPPKVLPRATLGKDETSPSEVSIEEESPVLVVRFQGSSRTGLKFEFASGEPDIPVIRAAALLPGTETVNAGER